MRTFALMLKDLQQIARDKKSALFLVLMPILFTVFFGFAAAGSPSDPRLPVGWINDDKDSPLSSSLRRMLEQSETIRLVEMEKKDIERVDKLVRDQKLAAALVLPEGFSARAAAAQSAQLTLVVLPNTTAGQSASTAVQSAVKRVLGVIEIARISAEVLQAKLAATGEPSSVDMQEAATMASDAWQEPALDVRVARAEKLETKKPEIPQGFRQSSPGMIVQFAVFGLVTSAMVLVLERKSGTLQRMLTAPVHRAEIIAGHMLAMFGLGFLQTAMLVALGQFVFGVNYLREPAGTLLMMVTLSLWSASLGLVISAASKTEEQVVLFSLIAMFVFAALGGAWFPLEIAGEAFARVGHVMPTAWAIDGFQNIVLRGLGLSSTLIPAGILSAYTLVFFAFAVWRFKFE